MDFTVFRYALPQRVKYVCFSLCSKRLTGTHILQLMQEDKLCWILAGFPFFLFFFFPPSLSETIKAQPTFPSSSL